MLLIVLIVMFTLVMFLWLLSMLGAIQNPPGTIAAYSPWLAWFACLILGIVVFLVGSGIIVVQSTLPVR